MSYPGEPDRFFERISGRRVGDGTCCVSIGGKSRLILKDSGNVAGFYDVTGQSEVESARGKTLIERRPGELEMLWCRLFGDTLLDKSRSSGKPSRSTTIPWTRVGKAGGSGGDGAAAEGKVHACSKSGWCWMWQGPRSRLWERKEGRRREA